jgi:hypothetical protein
MTRGIGRLGAAVAALALLAGVAAPAWAARALTVELEKDSCAGPVAAVAARDDGTVVFHHLDAGRYVISLPAEAGGMTLAVSDPASGRWISGRLSAAADGRRYAIGGNGERIVVTVAGDGEIHIRLAGR